MPIHTGKTNPTAIPHPGYQCLIVLFLEKISVGVYRASHLSCGACRNRWYDLFPIVWQGPVMDYYCSRIYTGYRCCNKDSADLPGLSFPQVIHHGDFYNVLLLIAFSLLVAVVLHRFGIRFMDGLICSAGVSQHI